MAELKKPRIREAKIRDVGLFRKLWREFLDEQEKMGSVIKGSDKNIQIYERVFNFFVNKDEEGKSEYEGVVLFIGEVAMVMAGDNGIGAELTIGHRPANVFGLYVTPDHRGKGLGIKLYEECFKRLKAMGFDAVMGNALTDNEHGTKTLEKAAGNATRVPESPMFAKLS